MRILLGGLFLVLAGCGTVAPESRLIRDTVRAVGGADLIAGVNTLVLEGTGDAYNLGQNARPDGPLPRLEVTEYRKIIDFSNKQWRQELVQIPRYVTANMNPQERTTAVDNGVGFNIAANGDTERQSDAEGSARNAELYHHPIGILQAALNPEGRVSNFRSIGMENSVDIVTPDGGEYTLYVDETTRLPSRVQSMGYYPRHLGDVIFETQFGEYEDVEGMRLPTQLTSMLDRYDLLSVNVSNVLNTNTVHLGAPDDVKSALISAPTPNVDTEEVGRGLWYLTGQSHNSMVVEFEDHLTLIEAPQGDLRTLAVIAVARQLNPRKPLTTVVNTHHHFDHSGGIRAAVAEGLIVITHEANRSFYEDSASRSHRLSPDALERDPRPIQIETISAPYVLSDDTRTVEIYPIEESLHADTLLMIYFPTERALLVADVYSTPNPDATNPRFPHVANLLENIRNYGLRVDRVFPIHGEAEPFSSVTLAAQTEARAAAVQSE